MDCLLFSLPSTSDLIYNEWYLFQIENEPLNGYLLLKFLIYTNPFISATVYSLKLMTLKLHKRIMLQNGI